MDAAWTTLLNPVHKAQWAVMSDEDFAAVRTRLALSGFIEYK